MNFPEQHSQKDEVSNTERSHLHAASKSPISQPTMRISYILLLATLGLYILVGLINLNAHEWNSVWAICCGLVLLVLPVWLLRNGHLRAGNLILTATELVTVTALATVGQGIHDVALLGYPILLLFAGLVLDRTSLRLYGALTFFAVLWLALGESFHLFATVPLMNDPFNLFYLVGIVAILLVAELAVEILSSLWRRNVDQLYLEVEEHKRTEAALQISRNRYQDLVETTGDFVWEMDARGCYTYCSPQMKTLWGFNPQEMLGKTPFDQLPPEDRAQAMKELIGW
jgi:PAS domain-containing protein